MNSPARIAPQGPLEALPLSARPGRGLSFRGHLAIYTVALTLPILLLAGLLFWRVAETERARLETDVIDTARAISVSLDRELASLITAVEVLASSARLREGDLEGFHRRMIEIGRRQSINPILLDVDGQQLVNPRVPWGTPLPRSNLPIDPAALAAGRPFITGLFSGAVVSRPLFAVAQPILEGDKPVYILNVGLEVDRLADILRSADAPSNATLTIVDRDGLVMARSADPDRYIGRPAAPDFQKNTTGREGTWVGLRSDGDQVFASYRRTSLGDFRASVSLRVADLNAPLLRSLFWSGALFAVTVALSLLLGYVFGRRITAPIRGLAATAKALGRGEPLGVATSGIAEVDAVGDELARASVRLREREGDLREANEESQRFAYIVSHDLRSPLVNIMGFTTELESVGQDLFGRLGALRREPATRQDEALGSDFREAITFIKTSIGKMDRLINAILALSREGRRTFHPERVDMDVLLQSIVGGLAHQAEAAGATIRVSRLPAVVSDRLALEQVFTNLLDNAIKYRRADVATAIEVTGRATAAGPVYQVRDNGRGIAARDVERVFELFRRSGAQDRPGEGIGLAHVRALVRRLGGSIDLTSVPGQGSTFTVALPRAWTGDAQRKAA